MTQTRPRPRWKPGQLTGYTAAIYARGDHDEIGIFSGRRDVYHPNRRAVVLTTETGNGRRFYNVLCAVHEVMHGIQQAENGFTWRLYVVARWTWLPWAIAMAGAAVCLCMGDWMRAFACFVLTLFCNVLGGGLRLCVETDAWNRTERWVLANMITGKVEWEKLAMVKKVSLGNYLRAMFNR